MLARSDLGKHRNMSRTYRLSASHCQKNQHSQRARVSHLRVLQFPEAEIGIAYQPCHWPAQTRRIIIDGIFCYRTRLPSTPSLAPNRLWSSLSLESAKERISRVSGFTRLAVRRLSDNSLSHPFGISLKIADAITRINDHPTHSPVLRTVTFSEHRSFRRSRWDPMAALLHQGSTYTLLGR